MDALKDADGKPLGRRILEAGSNGEGSVEYRWKLSFYVKDPWGNGLCFVDEKTLFSGK